MLPPDVRARLSIEPGVALGWHKWVGDHGDSISIEHFGASAPGPTVLEQFGYNLDNVVARGVGAAGACCMIEADAVRAFLSLVSPGFCMEGELPAVKLEGVEVRKDGHAVAMVQADGRTLPLRFTFDEGRIARVEVL